jgi:hypothetical protein
MLLAEIFLLGILIFKGLTVRRHYTPGNYQGESIRQKFFYTNCYKDFL